MNSLKSHHRTLVILTSVFLMFSAGTFCISPWGEALDRVAYDTLFCLRGKVTGPPDIVIVAIDEPSFSIIGRQWPWPRQHHAKLIDNLFQAGAKTVAFDILFSDPSTDSDDAALEAAIKKNPGSVLASALETVDEPAFTRQIHTRPLERFLSDKTLTGVDTMPLDRDGFVRKSRICYSGAVSLSYSAAFQFSDDSGKKKLEQFKEACPEMLINFAGPPRTIKTISYYQALDARKFLPENLLKNKLVFVGFSIKNTADPTEPRPDHYPIPFVRQGSGYMAGVEIQANIAANLLRMNFIRQLDSRLSAVIIMVLTTLSATSLWKLTSVKGSILFWCLMLLVSISLLAAFNQWDLFVSPVKLFTPALACFLMSLFIRYLKAFREKQFIRQTFSRYLSPAIVTHLLKHPEKLNPGGNFAEATVFCLDIEGFSVLTQQMPADQLVDILSKYLGAFADIILKEKGMIDKIVGDGIMAVWGVPVAQNDHACLACGTALIIMDAVHRHNTEAELENRPELKIRIGINSGRVLAGNVSGKTFSNYTVHGEDVNFAARLEAINKIYGTSILIGENTACQLTENFVLRPIDTIRLRGKQGPQPIYELIGLRRDLSEAQAAFLDDFEQARQLYTLKNWKKAMQMLQAGLLIFPHDTPSTIYLNRCKDFENKAPQENWDGTHTIRL